MKDLVDTTEMYLRTVLELEEEGITPMRARIAERLHHSGPTVSQTVSRMEQAGLLTLTDDRLLELTEQGRLSAGRVMRKHRLAECLLVDVIGLPWETAHDEACRWEHVIGEPVERRLVELLGEPSESPYGNPIPALAELGVEDTPGGYRDGLASLDSVVGPEPVEVVLRRLAEWAQSDQELMGAMRLAGLVPSATATVEQSSDGVVMHGPTGKVALTRRVAGHVFVQLHST